jgi:hypothetical protein
MLPRSGRRAPVPERLLSHRQRSNRYQRLNPNRFNARE